MLEKPGVPTDLLVETIRDRKTKDTDVQIMRSRFQSYVDSFRRDAVEQDLAKPRDARELIRNWELADCAHIWMDEPTSVESGERMVKFLMVAAVVECTVAISFHLLPALNFV